MPDIELVDVPNIHWPASAMDISNTPPASHAVGDTYLIGTSPTGVWASYANKVAWFGPDMQWHFQSAFVGRRVYVAGSVNAYRQWNGTAWSADPTPSSGGSVFGRWDIDFIWEPAHQIPSSSFSTIGYRVYFVYLGLTKTTLNPTRIRYYIQTATFGTFVETGLFSSPSAPNRSSQTLTCLARYEDASTATSGDKVNSTPFSLTLQPETHVWYGYRSFDSNEGVNSSSVVRSVLGDFGRGSILTTPVLHNATPGLFYVFNVGDTYSGVVSTTAPQTSAAPYCYVTFD